VAGICPWAGSALAVPKAHRDAVVRLYAATTINPGALERAVEALQVPWPRIVSRQLRRILDQPEASSSPKAQQIVAYVEGEGLRAPRVPVEPAIGAGEVQLVCFQIVTT